MIALIGRAHSSLRIHTGGIPCLGQDSVFRVWTREGVVFLGMYKGAFEQLGDYWEVISVLFYKIWKFASGLVNGRRACIRVGIESNMRLYFLFVDGFVNVDVFHL